jgi:hypothetical protein
MATTPGDVELALDEPRLFQRKESLTHRRRPLTKGLRDLAAEADSRS